MKCEENFRPLPGHLISKFIIHKHGDLTPDFRPLPGHLISKSVYATLRQMAGDFRPLPGHLISKCLYPNRTDISHCGFPSPSGASHFQIKNCFTMNFSPVQISVPFRGISFPNPILHTPHSMRSRRAFCVGKPNRSIFHVLRLSKIPANPAFKPCAGKSSSPSPVTHLSLPL